MVHAVPPVRHHTRSADMHFGEFNPLDVLAAAASLQSARDFPVTTVLVLDGKARLASEADHSYTCLHRSVRARENEDEGYCSRSSLDSLGTYSRSDSDAYEQDVFETADVFSPVRRRPSVAPSHCWVKGLAKDTGTNVLRSLLAPVPLSLINRKVRDESQSSYESIEANEDQNAWFSRVEPKRTSCVEACDQSPVVCETVRPPDCNKSNYETGGSSSQNKESEVDGNSIEESIEDVVEICSRTTHVAQRSDSVDNESIDLHNTLTISDTIAVTSAVHINPCIALVSQKDFPTELSVSPTETQPLKTTELDKSSALIDDVVEETQLSSACVIDETDCFGSRTSKTVSDRCTNGEIDSDIQRYDDEQVTDSELRVGATLAITVFPQCTNQDGDTKCNVRFGSLPSDPALECETDCQGTDKETNIDIGSTQVIQASEKYKDATDGIFRNTVMKVICLNNNNIEDTDIPEVEQAGSNDVTSTPQPFPKDTKHQYIIEDDVSPVTKFGGVANLDVNCNVDNHGNNNHSELQPEVEWSKVVFTRCVSPMTCVVKKNVLKSIATPDTDLLQGDDAARLPCFTTDDMSVNDDRSEESMGSEDSDNEVSDAYDSREWRQAVSRQAEPTPTQSTGCTWITPVKDRCSGLQRSPLGEQINVKIAGGRLVDVTRDGSPPVGTLGGSLSWQPATPLGGRGFASKSGVVNVGFIPITGLSNSAPIVSARRTSVVLHPLIDHDYCAFSEFSADIQSSIIATTESKLRTEKKYTKKKKVPTATLR